MCRMLLMSGKAFFVCPLGDFWSAPAGADGPQFFIEMDVFQLVRCCALGVVLRCNSSPRLLSIWLLSLFPLRFSFRFCLSGVSVGSKNGLGACTCASYS